MPAAATLGRVLGASEHRRGKRTRTAEKPEEDSSLWDDVWPVLATVGASAFLTAILRSRGGDRRTQTTTSTSTVVPEQPELDAGIRDSRVLSTYDPNSNPKRAPALFQRLGFPGLAVDPDKPDTVAASDVEKAIGGDIEVVPSATKLDDVRVELRRQRWPWWSRDMAKPLMRLLPETPRTVAYHETGHGYDPNDKSLSRAEDRADLRKALIAGAPLPREKIDQLFEGEIPAMAIENSAAMASGFPKPSGWVYDMMQKQIPIVNDTKQDAKAIKAFMSGLRSPDTELGRRYLDYLKAQGVQPAP